jgi:hypothetical protein
VIWQRNKVVVKKVFVGSAAMPTGSVLAACAKPASASILTQHTCEFIELHNYTRNIGHSPPAWLDNS